ncbi:MAG TPA: helix-turn-helix domain-containing protein [Terriglobales bacterium]
MIRTVKFRKKQWENKALHERESMPDGGREGEKVMSELAFASSSEDPVIKDAQRLLKSQYAGAPKVLDVFGGGGTIPYEAALLGAEVSSLDYNPLSVFIQKSNLEFSQEALASLKLSELVTVVKESGTRVLEALRERTKDFFPLREGEGGKGVFAYFWSYRLRTGRREGTTKAAPSRARTLRKQGLTVLEIAQALGVKERTVYHYLRR